MADNYFKELYDIDFSSKVEQKNGLSYSPWTDVWAEVKKKHGDATYHIYEQELSVKRFVDNEEIITTFGRPWFDDGKTGWVKTGVTINGIEHIEDLPILDFKNKAIAASAITSADANKAIQRSITKACARHGCGLHVYQKDEHSEEITELTKIRAEIMDLMKKKVALSEEAKSKVEKLCKEADADANGDPRLIEDLEVLKKLKKNLMAVRK